MDVYNILTIEITAEDLRSAATNSGKFIPLAPNTRSVNIKGIVQTPVPPPVPASPEPPKSAAGE